VWKVRRAMTKLGLASLPHERWFADYAVERQRTHRNAFNMRMDKNYGPEGIQLFWFGLANGILGWAIVVVGIVVMLLSIAAPPLFGISVGVVGVGCALVLIGLLRMAQCSKAGHIYRDGRPYIRGPK